MNKEIKIDGEIDEIENENREYDWRDNYEKLMKRERMKEIEMEKMEIEYEEMEDEEMENEEMSGMKEMSSNRNNEFYGNNLFEENRRMLVSNEFNGNMFNNSNEKQYIPTWLNMINKEREISSNDIYVPNNKLPDTDLSWFEQYKKQQSNFDNLFNGNNENNGIIDLTNEVDIDLTNEVDIDLTNEVDIDDEI
jgi:hypothetical protein